MRGEKNNERLELSEQGRQEMKEELDISTLFWVEDKRSVCVLPVLPV